MEQITKSEKETRELVGKILDIFPFKEHATVFVLEGELGSGKTTFVKGLEEILKIRIKSPTFNIINKYKIDFKGFKYLYHIDFYRVNNVLGLEFEEILKSKENLIFIEWGSNVLKAIPRYAKWLYFEYKGEDKRRIYEKNNNY